MKGTDPIGDTPMFNWTMIMVGGIVSACFLQILDPGSILNHPYNKGRIWSPRWQQKKANTFSTKELASTNSLEGMDEYSLFEKIQIYGWPEGLENRFLPSLKLT